MDHHPSSGARAYGWEDAWDTYDDPELQGVKKYRLPRPDTLGDTEPFRGRTLTEGDRFWNTEERYMITVTDVMTKIYRGVVGPAGEEGDDCVFYETDWNPPKRPGGFTESYHPHRDDEPFCMRVEKFAELVADGVLVAHTENGITPPP